MKKLYSHLGCLTLFFLASFIAHGQTKISGTVLDEKAEGLAGVNLIVKGRVIGTVTDLNGKFNLTISDNPPLTIVASFIGYRTQEIKIENEEKALEVTSEHPFYIKIHQARNNLATDDDEGEWEEVRDLEVGDEIRRQLCCR